MQCKTLVDLAIMVRLGFHRVIHQSIALDERNRMVVLSSLNSHPFSPQGGNTKIAKNVNFSIDLKGLSIFLFKKRRKTSTVEVSMRLHTYIYLQALKFMQILISNSCKSLSPFYANPYLHYMQILIPVLCKFLSQLYANPYLNYMQILISFICKFLS